jgi:hypothetical protein
MPCGGGSSGSLEEFGRALPRGKQANGDSVIGITARTSACA